LQGGQQSQQQPTQKGGQMLQQRPQQTGQSQQW
jgi:hypothetical protein